MQCYRTGYDTIEAEVLCCPDCGGTEVFRRSSRGDTAHWRCRGCDHRWTEAHAVGLGKVCNAKLVTPADITEPEPGAARRDATLRCCAGCASTRVRPTTTNGRIAYWYCEACSLGWSELARAGGWSELNVKLVRPPGGIAMADRAAAG